VAIALNILDLLVVERVKTSHKVAEDACSEAAGPLNDIASDAASLIDEFIGHDDLRNKLQQIVTNVNNVRQCLRQVADGPNTMLGAADVKTVADDPVLGGAEVLVADDEPNMRATVSDVLRKYGVTVTVCANGGEAIAQIEQRQRPFDLVISDIKMPDRTGYDVFAAARRKSATVPVILMTGFGYDPNHSIVRASQEGLQAVLFKPFKVDLFLAEVRKALQSQPASRS
jgi:CheY-like chemotaxis protein